MSSRKSVVLDANILLRAVFGNRVRTLIESYGDTITFYAPDVCFADAEKYIPLIAEKRRIDPEPGLSVLQGLSRMVEIVDQALYEQHESSAKVRIRHRDINDWPVVATALALNAPIWTEDQDFLGSGISTWTTQTIEIYLRDA